MIPLYTLRNAAEASAVELALKEAGVNYMIKSFEDTAYNGIFAAQKGFGQVLVDEGDRQIAAEIIATICY